MGPLVLFAGQVAVSVTRRLVARKPLSADVHLA